VQQFWNSETGKPDGQKQHSVAGDFACALEDVKLLTADEILSVRLLAGAS
jgi:hypothetical protein